MLILNVIRISNVLLRYILYTLIWKNVTFWYKQKCLKELNPEKVDVAVSWTGLSIIVTKCKKCICVFYEYWHPMTCDNFRIGIWNRIWEEYGHVQSYGEKIEKVVLSFKISFQSQMPDMCV